MLARTRRRPTGHVASVVKVGRAGRIDGGAGHEGGAEVLGRDEGREDWVVASKLERGDLVHDGLHGNVLSRERGRLVVHRVDVCDDDREGEGARGVARDLGDVRQESRSAVVPSGGVVEEVFLGRARDVVVRECWEG